MTVTIKAQRFHHGRETALSVMIFVECPRDIHTKSYFVLMVNPHMLFDGRQWDSETKGLSEALPPRTDLGCDTASICLTVKSVCVCVCVCVCEVALVMSNSLQPQQAPLFMGFSRQEYWSVLLLFFTKQ